MGQTAHLSNSDASHTISTPMQSMEGLPKSETHVTDFVRAGKTALLAARQRTGTGTYLFESIYPPWHFSPQQENHPHP